MYPNLALSRPVNNTPSRNRTLLKAAQFVFCLQGSYAAQSAHSNRPHVDDEITDYRGTWKQQTKIYSEVAH